MGLGVYVCVMDSDKNDQTTCINVVNCKIVTETCQLFFLCAVRLGGFRSPLLCAALGSDCPALLFGSRVKLVFYIASKTRSYQYKRFPYPSFRAISCKRVYASKRQLLLCIILYHISDMMSRFSSEKFAFGVKFMQKSAKHI